MKYVLLGKNLADIRPLLREFDFIPAANGETPEVVITHGGDGALLGAEREYPGILKFPLRDAATAPTCPQHNLRSRLAEFFRGECQISKLPKVAVEAGPGRRLLGINDVFIHSASFTSALRYRVFIDGELYANEVIGDGCLLATVHGSGAYYRSITHSVFKTGLGLAFSNSTESLDHMVLDCRSRIEIEIIRGPALLTADNSEVRFALQQGEKAVLYQSPLEFASVAGLKDFMCQKCRILRHRNVFYHNFQTTK